MGLKLAKKVSESYQALAKHARFAKEIGMEIEPTVSKPIRSVRWPFRMLAALIVLAGLVSLLGVAMAIRSDA